MYKSFNRKLFIISVLYIIVKTYSSENIKFGGIVMGKSRKMDFKAARRIQSHADRTGRNQGFKSRAMRAASKNTK